MDFRYLTEVSTFQLDERVGFVDAPSGVRPHAIPESNWAWVPERLWVRLIRLGQAYEMHFASVLELDKDSELNSVQCEHLLEELEYVGKLVNDAALWLQIEQISRVVAREVQNPERSLCVSTL